MPSAMNHLRRGAMFVGALVAMLLPSGAALAEQPAPWQLYFDEPASPIMVQIVGFNNWIMIVITVIVLFVLALLGWCMIRYNSRSNPVPSRTSHNTVVEVLWTVVPVLILVAIAIPSFSLLFAQYDPARAIEGYDPDTTPTLTMKATANTWAWTYDYPDNGDISLFSMMVPDEELVDANGVLLDPERPRKLTVDQEFIVPVNTVIRLQVTASDILHAFALPAMGVKTDAVPGRLLETWFRADREGIFYGQCSELCGQSSVAPGTPLAGTGHAFMPIALRVVSEAQFEAWAALAATGDVTGANRLLAGLIENDPRTRVAAN